MNTVLATQSPATESQLNKLHELFDEKFDAETAASHHEWLNTHRLSKATASERLKALFAMQSVNELDEGMYKVGEDIFKVYHTRDKGILVTKQLIEGTFEYTGRKPLAQIKPEHRMTLDQAKEYGKVTGTCCVCAAKLTNEESIEAGIGPICASKF
jgi:N-acyl-D-aspartate/D-glutamate deacylase